MGGGVWGVLMCEVACLAWELPVLRATWVRRRQLGQVRRGKFTRRGK